MRRIGLAVILAVSLVLAPLAAEAQQTGKVPRIGILHVSPVPVTNLIRASRVGALAHYGANVWAEPARLGGRGNSCVGRPTGGEGQQDGRHLLIVVAGNRCPCTQAAR